MSASLDLSLPAKAPTESHRNENHDMDKFAVYTLVDLGRGGDFGLREAIGKDDEYLRDRCHVLPECVFRGAPLKAVYDYHLESKTANVHPTLFVVAQYQDYEKDGVLLVNLDSDSKCSVDTCRLEASDVMTAAVNIEIANADWEDYKANELIPPRQVLRVKEATLMATR
jgi:hypothetical protein